MQIQLRSLVLILVFFSLYLPAVAQTTLITQALASSAVCPGTLLEIPFSLTGTTGAGNRFSVQFTKGTEVTTLPASTVIGNPATGQYVATLAMTNSPGTGTYKVRVVTSNPVINGQDSPTALFIKTLPTSAPTLVAQFIGNFTSQYTFCQNDSPLSLSMLVGPAPDNYRILYDHGTGLASTNQRTYISPIITTSVVGRTTYNLRYVAIDETKGCNLPEQVGSVSYLNTEVKFRPAAPSLPASSFTYCQGQAASPLVATAASNEADLLWYNASGTALVGVSPTPSTAFAGNWTYQVSQSLDRCESPRALVNILVKSSASPPTTAKPMIELCRGVISEPLSASGTNLVWTDPTGAASSIAPIPSTLNASKTADGDVYYVTQTGPDGCMSTPLAIRVLVQAPPTLSLSGGKNINLGIELPLQLAFTGTGPYQYRITSNPGSVTLTGTASKDTSLLLLPEQSAVYQVSEVKSSCGVGLPGSPATATVVVLVPTIRTLTLQAPTACAGNNVTAIFQTTGTFNLGNLFKLQVARITADTARPTYTDLAIVQQIGTSQLTGVLPATATSGRYLVRVIATNPKIAIIGTPSATTLTVLGQVSATLTTTTPTITDGEVAKLAVNFTGDGPWTFTYRDSTDVLGAIQTITSTTSPYLLESKLRQTTTYRLTSISNGCSLNTNIPNGRVVVTVAPLLGIEPLASQVVVYPVPATTQVTVQIDPSLLTNATTLQLVNEKGTIVLKQTTRQERTQLSLAEQPAGMYVVQVVVDGQTVSRRILKQ